MTATESPVPTLCVLTEPDPAGGRAATFEVIGQNNRRFAVKLRGSTPPSGWDAARKYQLRLADTLLHYQFPG